MEILYYTCLIIVIILSLYLVFRKRKKKHVEEYKTPYQSAFDKSKADFRKGERDE